MEIVYDLFWSIKANVKSSVVYVDVNLPFMAGYSKLLPK